MHLVFGLGNKGEQYDGTRHNVGADVLSVIEGEIDGVVTARPSSFMNESGGPVAKALKEAGAEPENLIVIHDDIDLPIGSYRIAHDRGAGGHNGVQNIIDTLKTKNFTRIRIGISPTTLFGKMKKPQGEGKVSRYVLAKFSAGENRKVMKLADQISEGIMSVVSDGPEAAMNKFN